MKLSLQVTSVAISNKLLDLEVRKPSQFYRDYRGAGEDEILMWQNPEGDVCLDNVNCYTLSELAAMTIPAMEALEKQEGVKLDPPQELTDMINKTIYSMYQPDWMAKMLIYLIEEHKIQV